METESKQEKQARIESLAEKIKLLFEFCGMMIKDRDLVKEVLEDSERRASYSLSAAPLLGAVGMDYEAIEFDARLHGKRAGALLNLLDTLAETEESRAEFSKSQQQKAEGRETIKKMLGL